MLKESTFVKRKYWKMFLAAVLGWVVSLLGGMADSIIAGMYLDSEAVSAVGLITPITSIMYFLSLSIAVGCAILYSRTLGAFKIEKSRKIAGMGLCVSIGVGLVVGVLLFLCKDLILQFYGVTGTLYTYSMAYFFPVILFCSFYPPMWTIYYLVSYDGDEGIILAVDILMAVLNSVFSFVLIQKIGIAGLGYGTLLANAVGFAVMIPHFFKKSNSIHFTLHFSWKEMLEILKLSSASSLTSLYLGIIDVVFNKLVIDQFTEVYLPAYAVINVVMNFACALICAINAGQMFVTVAYGENNPYAIKRIMKLTNQYTVGISLVLTVIMELLAGVWPVLYAIENPDVFAASLYAGRIVPAFFLVAGFVYTYMGYYSSVGKLVEGNILSICYMLLGPIVICVPLAHIFGFNAMSLGFGLTPVFALLVVFLYILARKQLHKAPYLLTETEDTEVHYDLKLEESSILTVRNEIGDFLRKQNTASAIIHKVQMVFEDSMTFIMKKNPKKRICEATLLVNPERVKLITKDNGIIFDIMKEADDAVDFQAYVLARMSQDAKEATNSTTISFNRNVCVWEQ